MITATKVTQTGRIFLHMFQSIDQPLHPTGRMPWIILHQGPRTQTKSLLLYRMYSYHAQPHNSLSIVWNYSRLHSPTNELGGGEGWHFRLASKQWFYRRYKARWGFMILIITIIIMMMMMMMMMMIAITNRHFQYLNSFHFVLFFSGCIGP